MRKSAWQRAFTFFSASLIVSARRGSWRNFGGNYISFWPIWCPENIVKISQYIASYWNIVKYRLYRKKTVLLKGGLMHVVFQVSCSDMAFVIGCWRQWCEKSDSWGERSSPRSPWLSRLKSTGSKWPVQCLISLSLVQIVSECDDGCTICINPLGGISPETTYFPVLGLPKILYFAPFYRAFTFLPRTLACVRLCWTKNCIKTNVSEVELNICRSHIENISVVQLCRARHLQSFASLAAKHFSCAPWCCEPVWYFR